VATHAGEIMGLAPTNREFAYEHIHILRFKKDRAVEHWGGSERRVARSLADRAKERVLGPIPA
jgi:predicted ester cyclase